MKTDSPPLAEVDRLFSELDHRQKLSIADLAKLAGFSYKQISTAVKRGLIPGAKRQDRGKWKIPRDGAEYWWAHLERPPKITTTK